MVPYLETNLSINQATIERRGGKIQALALSWASETEIEAVRVRLKDLEQRRRGRGGKEEEGPDFITASEVTYSTTLFKPLLATIAALAGPRTLAIVGIRARGGCDVDEFLSLLDQHFQWERIDLKGEAVMVATFAGEIHSSGYVPQFLRLRRKA